MKLPKWMERAMWDGDDNLLKERAPCGCCCWEHTGEGCPARAWGGCRGQGNVREDEDEWARHYEKFHGMSKEKFFGG